MVWYRFEKKQTTDDLLQLSVASLKRLGYLRENAIANGGLSWKRTYSWGDTKEIASVMCTSKFIGEKRTITLAYTYNGKDAVSLEIPIIYSNPYFGGKRYWFLCPRCGRKVAFLYGGKQFWCRHCHNLSYPTQQIGYVGRMFERSGKYQRKVLKDGCRKRWLHYSTLEKYLDKSEYYEMRGLAAMYKNFKRML